MGACVNEANNSQKGPYANRESMPIMDRLMYFESE